jgi:hypothetical protein
MRSDLRVVVAVAFLIASAQASRAADICDAVALRLRDAR